MISHLIKFVKIKSKIGWWSGDEAQWNPLSIAVPCD